MAFDEFEWVKRECEQWPLWYGSPEFEDIRNQLPESEKESFGSVCLRIEADQREKCRVRLREVCLKIVDPFPFAKSYRHSRSEWWQTLAQMRKNAVRSEQPLLAEAAICIVEFHFGRYYALLSAWYRARWGGDIESAPQSVGCGTAVLVNAAALICICKLAESRTSRMFTRIPSLTDNLRKRLNDAGFSRIHLVPVIPDETCRQTWCWVDVPRLVQSSGGDVVSGRTVWKEKNGNWLNLEAHALWRKLDGSLVDPTAKGPGIKETVFVEDELQYSGKCISSVYICLSKSRRMRQFVALLQKLSDFKATVNVGDTAQMPMELRDEYAASIKELFPEVYYAAL